MEQSSIEQDFRELCQQYGLPEGEKALYLAMIFEAGASIMPASSGLPGVFEQARMLKQISFAKRGFSLLVGGIKWDYGAELVEVLRKALVDALHQRVAKRVFEGQAELGINVPASLLEDFKGLSVNMIFSPVSGAGERTIWLHPEGCQPQEEVLNESELDAIIAFGDELKKQVEKMQGRRGTGEVAGPDKSKNPELGGLAGLLLSYLPEDWGTIEKYAFVFDFLELGGWLHFKGEEWEHNARYYSSKEKYDVVKSWVRTAEKIKK